MKPQLANDKNLQKMIAKNLRIAKARISRKTNISTELEKKQTKEETQYYKKKLLQACHYNQIDDVEKYLRKLINLRARQMSVFLQEQNPEKKDTDTLLKNRITKYYEDCYKLIHSSEILLTTTNG